MLRAKGITRVRPLEGGIDAGLADNLPFVIETRGPLSEGAFLQPLVLANKRFAPPFYAVVQNPPWV